MYSTSRPEARSSSAPPPAVNFYWGPLVLEFVPPALPDMPAEPPIPDPVRPVPLRLLALPPLLLERAPPAEAPPAEPLALIPVPPLTPVDGVDGDIMPPAVPEPMPIPVLPPLEPVVPEPVVPAPVVPVPVDVCAETPTASPTTPAIITMFFAIFMGFSLRIRSARTPKPMPRVPTRNVFIPVT
jgi:hypothetical protein